MPTTDSRQVVTEFIATVFNSHDLKSLSRFVDNDRLVQAASGLVQGVPDLHLAIEHVIAEDDLVAIRFTGDGTHLGFWRGLQPTGKHWKATCNAHYRVANGRIVDFWVNWDWLSIMQQLGAITVP